MQQERKESIIVTIWTVINNYRGISVLSASHKFLWNILLPRITPYAIEIIGEYQCRFRRNRSNVDLIFSTRQTLENKWDNSNEVYQLFIDFEKIYDSIKRESLYDIPIKFGGCTKKLGLIMICLDRTQSKVRIGNYLYFGFLIENLLKQEDALSSLLFNFKEKNSNLDWDLNLGSPDL